jgi:dolichol-phosphate mannosyltransferase
MSTEPGGGLASAAPPPAAPGALAVPRRRGAGAIAAALLTDIGGFALLMSLGLGLEAAQMLAFAAAVGVGLVLRRAGRGAASIGAGAGRVAVLALVLPVGFAVHAAVLTLGIDAAGLAPALAVAPAALVGAGVVGGGLVWLARAGADPSPDRWWAALALFAVAALLLLRLVYAPLLELTPQEGYYWQFAQHLALGYLDHPPLTGWLIAASTLAGDTEFWVRVPAMLASLLTVLMAAAWARDLAGPVIAWRTALLAAVLPYFFLAGFVMTPDAPLAAAWAAALFALHRALTRGSTGAWIAAGVVVGLGLVSKYTMVLLPLAVIVWLTLERRWLETLRRPGPWLATGAALLVFSPVVVWNAQHDWASFVYQGSRRLAPEIRQFELHWLMLAIVVLLTPWGVLALGRAARSVAVPATPAAATPGLDSTARRFCWVFTLVPLAPLAEASLWTESKFHWSGPIWLAALPLLAATMTAAPVGAGGPPPTRLQRLVARGWGPTVALLMAVYALPMLYYAVHGVAGHYAHHRYLETNWRELRLQVQAIEDAVVRETGRRPAVIGLDRHDTANLMAFHDPRGDGPLDTAAHHIVFDQPAHMYRFWFQPADFAGRDLVLVSCSRGPIEDPRLAPQAGRLDPVQVIPMQRRGVATRECYARVLWGFRPAAR